MRVLVEAAIGFMASKNPSGLPGRIVHYGQESNHFFRRLMVLAVLVLLHGLCGAAPGAEPEVRCGPLREKARVFDELIQKDHCPNGMIFSYYPDAQGNFLWVRGGGDSTIWTGCYVASQVFRYKATGDPVALKNIERSLAAFQRLHRVSGGKGFLGRCFGPPELFPPGQKMTKGCVPHDDLVFIPDTSRDQYSGLFLAYSLALPLIEKNNDLFSAVQEDIRVIGRNLATNNLALRAELEGRVFFPFNVNPTYCYQDRINPEEWARVDDFPANVFAATVPYSDRLAAILSRFSPPPVRGGEALRALLMMSTVSRWAEDPELSAFYRDELCGRREFPRVASETSQLLSEIFAGKNSRIVEEKLGELGVAFLRLFRDALVITETMSSSRADAITGYLTPSVRAIGVWAGRGLAAWFERLNRPGAFRVFLIPAEIVESWADSMKFFGAVRPATRFRGIAAWLREIAGSNMREFLDAQRSYVGLNITMLPLLGILEAGSPELLPMARDILDRAYATIATEGNAFYTYIRAAHGNTPIDPERLAEARQTLLDYPVDCRNRVFDYSRNPDSRALPWPDRFGRYQCNLDRVLPVNMRGPHIFIWQEPPRRMVSGADDNARIAPVGYLTAYWLGRAHGFLTPED
jgi:hypothetical protein